MPMRGFMPTWHFREYHSRLVRAEPAAVFNALMNLHMSNSPLVRVLFWARELPWRLAKRDFRGAGLGLTLEDMQRLGFILLERRENQELVLGLVAQPWKLKPQMLPLPPRQFAPFAEPGYIKVTANFLVEPVSPSLCRLSTETRVFCLDEAARRAFRIYWAIIRLGSGLIRHEMLRLTRQAAESAPQAGQA